MKKNLKLIIALLSLAFFLLILLSLSNPYLLSIDSSVSSLIIKIQNQYLVKIAEIIGYIFEPINSIIIILIISVVISLKGLKKDSVFLALTGSAAGIFIYTFKELINRTRPLNQVVQETGFSFPSGHSTIAVILFGFLIYLSLKYVKSSRKMLLIIFSLIFILLIGFSRLYINVHWLSDILGGYALGLFLLMIGLILKENLTSKK